VYGRRTGIGVSLLSSTTLRAQRAGAVAASLSRIMPDGTTAWYIDQRGIVINGNLFYSTSSGTTSRGSTEIVRVSPQGNTTIWNVLPYIGANDHNNASFLQLSDGRLVAFFQIHTDVAGTRYRVSLAAAPDIKGWGVERQIALSGGASVSYTHPFILNDDKIYLFRRNNIDTGGAGRRQQLCVTTESSLIAGTETWTSADIFENDPVRPYPKYVQNGADRVDIFTSNASPAEASDCGLYAGYAKLDAGTLKFYTSAGVEITASRPFNVETEFTAVQLPTATDINESWTYDATVGSDGHLRGLSMRYPTTSETDVEYWHHRWDGSAWVNTRLAQNIRYVYPAQPYVPGLVFDKRDATVIYMGLNQTNSELVTVGKYAFDEGTGAITLTQTIATDFNDAMRFHSPPGNTGDFELTFNYGNYTSFTAFEMDAWLYGTVAVQQPATPGSYLAETDALIARMSVAPSTARKDAIDRYIRKLKLGAISGNDIWAKIAGLYLLAAHDAQAARLNWKAASNDLTLVGTPTFVANSHITGNNTNYLQGPAPNAIGSPYTQNSAFLAAHTGRVGFNVIRRIAGGSPTLLSRTLSRVNGNGGTDATGAQGSFFLANRSDSANVSTYWDAALQRTQAITSTTLDTAALVICYEAGEAQMVAWGGALTADEAADFSNATWEYIREVVAPQNTTP
jgi:hypothetical protein